MKKCLIGMAAALACGTLSAQSAPSAAHTAIAGTDLTIYGVADMYVGHYRTEGASKTEVGSGGSGGSRLGFLAARQVTPALKAGVRLEAGINVDTGRPSSTTGRTDRVWSRQAYLMLSNSRYGEVRLGRLQGPAYDFISLYDPMLMPTADSWGVLTTLGFPLPGTPTGRGTTGGFNINPTVRTENSVEYVSPVIGGVQVKASRSLSESVATTPGITEISVNYSSGPLMLGVVALRAGATAGAGTTRPTAAVTETGIGAAYDFRVVKPYVTFLRKSITDQTINAGGAVTNANAERVSLVGAIIPVSREGAVRVTAGKYSSGSASAGARNMAIAYTHDLDPGLMVYTAYSRLTQDSAARYPLYLSPVPVAGKSVGAFIVGASWRF